MNIELYQNKDKKIIIDDKDFITEGGEGRIYGKNGIIYKLYIDEKKMIPIKKIEELKVLKHELILTPMDVLYNKSGSPVGFTMPWKDDTYPLCRLFTNDFRSRIGASECDIIALIENIVRGIKFIHSNKCIMVDGNEMNYLVDTKRINTPYFIDVDSYQTPTFPATAIMDSIRDYQATSFNEYSDWFSFAVVATQLFIGIHPYKGTHPDFGKSEMKRRMQQNVSIFNKEVRLPSAARDMSIIPSAYRDWLERVLEKGERLTPPDMVGQSGFVLSKKEIGTLTKFIIEMVREFKSHIIKVTNNYVISGTTLCDMGGKTYGKVPASTEVVLTPSGKPIKVWVETEKLHLEDFTGQIYDFKMHVKNKMVIGNSLYAIGSEKIVEIGIEEFGNKIIFYVNGQWEILPLSTQIFDGIVCQNDFGKMRLMLFYQSNSGNPACMIRKFDELNGYRITEAKYENHVAFLVGEKNGRYDNLLFKFSNDFSDYSFDCEEDVPYNMPNFVTLDNGVVVQITANDEVKVFRNSHTTKDVTVTDEKGITTDMRLCKRPGGVGFTIGSKLFSFRTAIN